MNAFVKLLFLGALVTSGGFVASVAFEPAAEAAVCARGVRGAACAGPRGAVGVRRAPVVRRPVYVRPRRVIVR